MFEGEAGEDGEVELPSGEEPEGDEGEAVGEEAGAEGPLAAVGWLLPACTGNGEAVSWKVSVLEIPFAVAKMTQLARLPLIAQDSLAYSTSLLSTTTASLGPSIKVAAVPSESSLYDPYSTHWLTCSYEACFVGQAATGLTRSNRPCGPTI